MFGPEAHLCLCKRHMMSTKCERCGEEREAPEPLTCVKCTEKK